MSTPLVGGVKDRGSGSDKIHSLSAEAMRPLGAVEEKEVQPEHQSCIEAWLSVRESERSEGPRSSSQPTLKRTVLLSSQGRSGGGEGLTDKVPPSQDHMSTSGTADVQLPVRKASVVQSSWQLAKQKRDSHSEPNKTAILLKPWQPSHASRVMVHDSDVSDDESV